MIHSDEAIFPYNAAFPVFAAHAASLVGTRIPAGPFVPTWVGDFTNIQIYVQAPADENLQVVIQWFDTDPSGQLAGFGQQIFHLAALGLLLGNVPTRLPWCLVTVQTGAADSTATAEVRLNNHTGRPLTECNYPENSSGLLPVSTSQGIVVPAMDHVDVVATTCYVGKAHLWVSGPQNCSVQLRATDHQGVDYGIIAQAFIIGTPAPDYNFDVGIPPRIVRARLSNNNSVDQTVFATLAPT